MSDDEPSNAAQSGGSGSGSSGVLGTGLAAGTVAGVLAFVVGGVGTIIAAMGDFGSDSGALSAARRNHVLLVVAAAAAAAFGLAAGALYIIYKDKTVNVGKRKRSSQGEHVAVPLGSVFLILGVLAVAAGVAMGAIATSAREPGKPTIHVTRIDENTIRVEITGEGLGSDDWYEAAVGGFDDAYTARSRVELATARFSPGQDGKLDWSVRINGADASDTKIARVLVQVARGSLDVKGRRRNCTEGKMTCLAIRVPIVSEAGSSPTTTTTATTTTTTTQSTTTNP